MKSLKIAGLCLASMLVMGMALAGNAAAGPLWLVCLPGENLTRYTNSKCLTAGGSGEPRWQSLGVRAGQSLTIRLLAFTVLFRDAAAKLAVTCVHPGSVGEGVIEAEGKGRIRVFELSNPKGTCTGVEGCEANQVEEVKGVNLSWGMEIVGGPNGKTLIKLSNGGGGGQPGWKIKCKIAGISVVNECVMEAMPTTEKVEAINEVTGGELLIRGRFEEAGLAKCTMGGEKSGKISGLFALLLPGGALSINGV